MTLSPADIAALRGSIDEVLSAECSSAALHAYADGTTPLDSLLWERAAELGWLSLVVPESHGGLGLGVEGAAMLNAALGRHVAPGPFISTITAALWIAEAGTAQQKDLYLPKLAAGGLSIAIPATMPHGPLKTDIRLLGACDSALAIVPVGVPGEGISWSLIELVDEPIGLPAWDYGRTLFDLHYDPYSIDAARLCRGEGDYSRLERLFAISIASDSLGLAQGLLERTIFYMKEREQFGQPIGAFQALKHRIADMHVRLSIDEQLNEQAVESCARGSGAELWPILAKAMLSAEAVRVADDCLQLHGGVGFAWDYDVHFYLRRARLNEALLGSNTIIIQGAAQAMDGAIREGRSIAELATP